MILILTNQAQLADWIQEAGLGDRTQAILSEASRTHGRYQFASRDEKRRLLRAIVTRVELRPAELVLDIDRQALLDLLTDGGVEEHSRASFDYQLTPIHLGAPTSIKRRGDETRMVLANGAASPLRRPILL